MSKRETTLDDVWSAYDKSRKETEKLRKQYEARSRKEMSKLRKQRDVLHVRCKALEEDIGYFPQDDRIIPMTVDNCQPKRRRV